MAQSDNISKQSYSQEIPEVLRGLDSKETGLSQSEAENRLAKFGANELKKEHGKSPIRLFLEQFKNILIIILLAATALSLAVGETIDAIVIIAIVIAVATLGFTQEFRAEKAIKALQKMTASTALVLRDGKEVRIKTHDIVPGDVLLLATGDKVPADARLIEAINLKTDEAPLTGESLPVDKGTMALPSGTPLTEQVNMVFTGGTVAYGRGKAVVTSTGMNTEFGKIARMVQATKKEKTPLEQRIGYVGKWLGILSISVCAAIVVLGILRQLPVLEMLLWGISLAVAAVPEALPAVVTGALALGMYRMARQRAIIRKLSAVETLGSTSVICSDKTGTMTKGEMTVQKVYVDQKMFDVTGVGYEPTGEFLIEGEKIDVASETGLRQLLKTAVLCNDARLQNVKSKWVVDGDSTEGALIVAAGKAGISKEDLEKSEPRISEIPFSSETKRMTTMHRTSDNKKIAYMKGAPESVLNRCSKILLDGKERKLSGKDKAEILKLTDDMANQALRNLGFAYKELPQSLDGFEEKDEQDFVYVGLFGMIDPPRPEVKDAINLCKKAGIKVVMITGDHKLTAQAVAKALDLIEEGDDCRIITGEELDKLSEEEFNSKVGTVCVYARVSPEHKLKIVNAWKSRGQIVAMTGDGVNDAPALKNSDIGVAMGITGTEVSKEASDMVLADDNFTTIVGAIREGREIFGNIKKYLAFLLQCNIMEILLLSIVMLVSFEPSAAIALTTIQILWINLVTDGLPAVALGVDHGDPDLMEFGPRNPRESVFSREVKAYLILTPILTTSLLLIGYFYHQPWLGEQNLDAARTQLFLAIVLIELAIAISCRSLRYPVYKVGIFKNKFLWLAVLSSLGLQLLVLYVPPLQGIFEVVAPDLLTWELALVFMIVTFGGIELGKYVSMKRNGKLSSR